MVPSPFDCGVEKSSPLFLVAPTKPLPGVLAGSPNISASWISPSTVEGVGGSSCGDADGLGVAGGLGLATCSTLRSGVGLRWVDGGDGRAK